MHSDADIVLVNDTRLILGNKRIWNWRRSPMFNAIEKLAYLSKVANEKNDLRFKDLHKIIQRPEFLEYVNVFIERIGGLKREGVFMESGSNRSCENRVKLSIRELSTALWNQSYKPVPVKKTELISKESEEFIPLDTSIKRDLIVQHAVKMVLEAIYEPVFFDASHGSRVQRSTRTAIKTIVSRTFEWVIEKKIVGCFENFNHGFLLDVLRLRIADEKFIELINKFLKSGYSVSFGFEKSPPAFKTEKGMLIKSNLSSLLANICLHELDKFIYERTSMVNHKEGLDVFRYVRYSETFVVMADQQLKEETEILNLEIISWLNKNLSLDINPGDSKLIHSAKGFNFQGYNIYQHKPIPNKGERYPVLRIYTPKKEIDNILSYIDIILRKYHNANLYDLVVTLNKVIGEWSREYMITNGWRRTAKSLDHKLFWKIMHWLGRKQKSSITKVLPKYYMDSSKGHYRTIIATSCGETKKRVELLRFRDFNYTNPFQ